MGGRHRPAQGPGLNVLVDTSVWVDFFNGYRSPQSIALETFLDQGDEVVTCGVVLAEFFQGLRGTRSVRELSPYFRDMACLAPSEPETYFRAAELFRGLRARGVTVRSTIDCLIVCLAAQHGYLLLAKDRDIELILGSGLSPARPAPLPTAAEGSALTSTPTPAGPNE